MVVSRLDEQQQFCDRHGWAEAELYPLPSDASFRTYTRLVKGAQSAMLMDAPPETENLAAYVRVARHLHRLGIRTPEIYGHDLDKGLALIEDFGDDTFTRLLDAGTDAESLYRQAARVLIHIQKSAEALNVKAPPYDEALLLTEVERFTDWFVPAVRGESITGQERTAYLAAWQTALKAVSADRSMLVVRDFHVDNLMILPEGEGLAACGLLDFQDALIGSPAYDLASLVEDARRDVSPACRQVVLDAYFDAFPSIDRAAFETQMTILAAQRHAKVLGLFARLSRRDNKHMYLKHIPRVAHLLAQDLEIPELAGVKTVIEQIVPGYETAEITAAPSSLYPE